MKLGHFEVGRGGTTGRNGMELLADGVLLLGWFSVAKDEIVDGVGLVQC